MSGAKFKLNLEYKMSYQEAYDAFLLLASRRRKSATILFVIALTAIAVVLLILFALDPRKVHYLFLAVIAILLLFYIIYQPALSARRGAKNVAKTNGIYKISLDESGRIGLPDKSILLFGEDKHARAAETDTIFALRVDKDHTICIPKRILGKNQEVQVRQMIEDHTHRIIHA